MNCIRLTESQLHSIIRECVSNVLNEEGIHIKKSNEGKFTATKKRTHKSTEELTHSKNPLTRKRAIFAQNAKKWNHKKKSCLKEGFDQNTETEEELRSQIDSLHQQVGEIDDVMGKKYDWKQWWMLELYFPDFKFPKEDKEILEKRNGMVQKVYQLEPKLEKILKIKQEEMESELRHKNREKFKEQEDIIEFALDEFGTTSDLNQAGYIMPDGSLLNFGHGGERTTDHRAIEGIFIDNGIKIWNDEYRYNYVVSFLNCGAIRIDASCGMIDMTQEPTQEEYSVIKRIARMNDGEVDIDFTGRKGDVEHSVSYESGTNPDRIVGDIYRYYNEGIKPVGIEY